MPRKSQGTRTNRSTKPAEVPARFEPGFLSKLDGRTEVARLLKGNYDAIASDLGGEPTLSHLKCSLIERTVFLESVLRQIEHELAIARQHDPGDKESAKVATELIGRWIQAVNSFSGLAKTLGIERQMTSRPWLSSPTDDTANEGTREAG